MNAQVLNADKLAQMKKDWDIRSKEMARQLGMPEDSEVIMMSTEIDYFDHEEELRKEFEDCGSVYLTDVLTAIEERTVHVKLPKGMLLVAMAPKGEVQPLTFGIVNLNDLENSNGQI